jgi:hypothetical protein
LVLAPSGQLPLAVLFVIFAGITKHWSRGAFAAQRERVLNMQVTLWRNDFADRSGGMAIVPCLLTSVATENVRGQGLPLVMETNRLLRIPVITSRTPNSAALTQE